MHRVRFHCNRAYLECVFFNFELTVWLKPYLFESIIPTLDSCPSGWDLNWLMFSVSYYADDE